MLISDLNQCRQALEAIKYTQLEDSGAAARLKAIVGASGGAFLADVKDHGLYLPLVRLVAFQESAAAEALDFIVKNLTEINGGKTVASSGDPYKDFLTSYIEFKNTNQNIQEFANILLMSKGDTGTLLNWIQVAHDSGVMALGDQQALVAALAAAEPQPVLIQQSVDAIMQGASPAEAVEGLLGEEKPSEKLPTGTIRVGKGLYPEPDDKGIPKGAGGEKFMLGRIEKTGKYALWNIYGGIRAVDQEWAKKEAAKVEEAVVTRAFGEFYMTSLVKALLKRAGVSGAEVYRKKMGDSSMILAGPVTLEGINKAMEPVGLRLSGYDWLQRSSLSGPGAPEFGEGGGTIRINDFLIRDNLNKKLPQGFRISGSDSPDKWSVINSEGDPTDIKAGVAFMKKLGVTISEKEYQINENDVRVEPPAWSTRLPGHRAVGQPLPFGDMEIGTGIPFIFVETNPHVIGGDLREAEGVLFGGPYVKLGKDTFVQEGLHPLANRRTVASLTAMVQKVLEDKPDRRGDIMNVIERFVDESRMAEQSTNPAQALQNPRDFVKGIQGKLTSPKAKLFYQNHNTAKGEITIEVMDDEPNLTKVTFNEVNKAMNAAGFEAGKWQDMGSRQMGGPKSLMMTFRAKKKEEETRKPAEGLSFDDLVDSVMAGKPVEAVVQAGIGDPNE